VPPVRPSPWNVESGGACAAPACHLQRPALTRRCRKSGSPRRTPGSGKGALVACSLGSTLRCSHASVPAACGAFAGVKLAECCPDSQLATVAQAVPAARDGPRVAHRDCSADQEAGPRFRRARPEPRP
jgi:hypothetical protein